jgi:hypothetical protein
MPRSQDKSTTAENLEEKFDRDEDVLDYLMCAKRVLSIRNPRATPRKRLPIQSSEAPIEAQRFVKNQRVIAKK